MTRNEILQKQIELMAETQFHIGQAIDKFKVATCKRTHIVEKMNELLVELHVEMEYLQEQKES